MLEENQNTVQIDTVDIETQPPYASHPGFKDWAYRLTLFLAGFLGLDIFTFILQLILKIIFPDWFVQENSSYVLSLTVLNTIRYVTLAIVFVVLLFPRLKVILKKFLDWKGDLLGLAFGAGIILATIVYNVVITQFIELPVNANEEAAETMIVTFPILSILVLGILGPICEEITYRYGLFSLLDKKSKVLAYILTPIIFAIIHFDFTGDLFIELLNLPSYIIAGIGLCFAYDKFGFHTAVIAHVTNNLYAIIVTLLQL